MREEVLLTIGARRGLDLGEGDPKTRSVEGLLQIVMDELACAVFGQTRILRLARARRHALGAGRPVVC